MGMKAVILGSGSALPDPERGNPSQAIVVDDEILLFDGVHKTDVEYVRQYIRALPPHMTEKPSESPAVMVEEIDARFVLTTDKFRVIAGEVEHHQRVGTPSVGFRIETAHGVVAISGDTRPCQGMIDLARGADLLIHDAAFLDEIIEARQMWSHSGPSGAGRVAQAAGVKKLVLTHLGPYTSADAAVAMAAMYYGPRRDPAIWDQMVAAARAHVDGPVVLARDALAIDIG
jgi:ribonuclease BN (tRNA processing enzyme)